MSRKLVALAAFMFVTLLSINCSDDSTTPGPSGGGGTAPDTVTAPAFSPTPGVYTTSQEVHMSCTTPDANIYYTTDGTDPNESSTSFVMGSGIEVGSSTTFRARAYKTGMVESEIAIGDYTLNIVNVETPVLDPPGGTYFAGQRVTATCATPNTTIYCTTDGSEPTQASQRFPGAGLNVSTTSTVRVRAYDSRGNPSQIGVGIYNIITGLVAYYPLNATGEDLSGNGYPATVYGPVRATDHAGVLSGAVEFDGTDDYIEISNESPFDFQEYTIMGWFWYDTLPPIQVGTTQRRYTLINKGAGYGNFTISLNKIGGASYCNLTVHHRTAAGNWVETCWDRNIYDSQWVHVAVTLGNEYNYYVNGQLVCTGGTVPAPVTNNDAVWFGRLRDADPEFFFDGRMDEVRFFNRVLSAAEVQQVYNLDN
jgi:hypothetical protein